MSAMSKLFGQNSLGFRYSDYNLLKYPNDIPYHSYGKGKNRHVLYDESYFEQVIYNTSMQ